MSKPKSKGKSKHLAFLQVKVWKFKTENFTGVAENCTDCNTKLISSCPSRNFSYVGNFCLPLSYHEMDFHCKREQAVKLYGATSPSPKFRKRTCTVFMPKGKHFQYFRRYFKRIIASFGRKDHMYLGFASVATQLM